MQRDSMQYWFLLRVCAIPVCCVFVDVCVVYTSCVCIFAFAYIFKFKVHCGSAVRFGRALPCYPITQRRTTCTFPAVLGLLAVWRHNKPKTKRFIRHNKTLYFEKFLPPPPLLHPRRTLPGGVLSLNCCTQLSIKLEFISTTMGQDFLVPIKPMTRLVLKANSSSQIRALSLRINSRNTQRVSNT